MVRGSGAFSPLSKDLCRPEHTEAPKRVCALVLTTVVLLELEDASRDLTLYVHSFHHSSTTTVNFVLGLFVRVGSGVYSNWMDPLAPQL